MENVIGAVITDIAMPMVEFNDADFSDAGRKLHLLGPQDSAAVFCLARHTIEEIPVDDGALNIMCLSIIWMKAFANTTASAAGDAGDGGLIYWDSN